MRQGEVGGAAATAEPERRDVPVTTDGDIFGRDAEKAREARDGEPTDRVTPRRELRKRPHGAAHGGGGITRRARHRMHVLSTHDHVDAKPALADAHGESRVGLAPDVEARWREHGTRVLLPRRLVGAFLRGPQEPADALGLRGGVDQHALRLVEDTAVEARMTTLGAALRITEVDDVISDHRNGSARAARAFRRSAAPGRARGASP